MLRSLLFFFFYLLLFTKLKKELAGIRIVFGIQTIIASAASILDKRLCRLGVTQQILLNKSMYFRKVWLDEKRTVQVINVPCYRLHAYAEFSCLCQNFLNLLLVSHLSVVRCQLKKAGKT